MAIPTKITGINNMDPIVKQTIINIAMESFIAGANGMKPSDFFELVHKLIDQSEAEPTLEELDPNAYASW